MLLDQDANAIVGKRVSLNPERPFRSPSLGKFVFVTQTGEWVVVLDVFRVVVSNVAGGPCPLGIEKAVSIVQHRDYLEQAARELLKPFTKAKKAWSLEELNFGLDAHQEDCQFLMRFSQRSREEDSYSDNLVSVDIGFSLLTPSNGPRMFTLIATKWRNAVEQPALNASG